MRSRTGKLARYAICALLISAACSADRGSGHSPVAGTIASATKSAEPRRAPLPPSASSSVPEFPSDQGATTATAPEPAPRESHRRCTRDDDCFPGFCDRGLCGEMGNPLNYGRECTPPSPGPDGPLPPPPPGGMWGPKAFFDEDVCGAYRCINGRCRSCQRDSDCGGGMTCRHVDGLPGKRCGDYSFKPPDPATVQQPPPPPGAPRPQNPPHNQILVSPGVPAP